MAISKKLLNDDEQVVVHTRTHAKALILPAVVLLVVAAVAGYLSSLPGEDHRSLWLAIIWVIAAVLLVWFVVWPFLVWLTATYTVTTRRLITRNGVITRRGHDIPLTRISDVSYERGLLDRILGCGTLVISDASEQGRVSLPDVPRVEQLQLKISDLLFSGHNPPAKADDGT